MAGNLSNNNSFYSENDALDINELASLNEDFSAEFIEQLQNQVSMNASGFTGKTNDDSTLFEEIQQNPNEEAKKTPSDLNKDIDDNFIKKYKARLNKQVERAQEEAETKKEQEKEKEPEKSINEPINVNNTTQATTQEEVPVAEQEIVASTPVPQPDTANNKDSKKTQKAKKETAAPQITAAEQIEGLTSGNIIEKPIQQENIKYNESLDYLDDNVKYSKYVIYIDPENTEFIESLTVKERKNLINKILREQDDIAITKRRLTLIQTVIKHAIIAIVTIAIAVPVVYFTINASLEASINNYRRSQTYFKTLYKEKGKIQKSKANTY